MSRQTGARSGNPLSGKPGARAPNPLIISWLESLRGEAAVACFFLLKLGNSEDPPQRSGGSGGAPSHTDT